MHNQPLLPVKSNDFGANYEFDVLLGSSVINVEVTLNWVRLVPLRVPMTAQNHSGKVRASEPSRLFLWNRSALPKNDHDFTPHTPLSIATLDRITALSWPGGAPNSLR